MRRREAPESTDPVPYRRRDRKADIRHGRRDGRKQIPTYTGLIDLVENAARITTPYQEQLVHSGLVRIHEEYQAFLDRTAAPYQQLGRLRGQLTADEAGIRRALEGIATASAELTDAELLPRNPQELAIGDGPALRSRRAAMRERRIAAAREQHEQRVATADGRRRQIHEVCGQIDHEFAMAQAAARRHGDAYVLRIATYWDALAQTHPEGRHLATLVPAIMPTLPPWVDATCQDGVITLPPSVTPPVDDPTASEAIRT